MQIGIVGLGRMGENDIRRASKLAEKHIRYIDCGKSGGESNDPEPTSEASQGHPATQNAAD